MADFLDVEPLSPMVVDCANGDAGTLYECVECRALAVFPSFSYPTCPQCLGGPMRALAMGVSASEAAARYGLKPTTLKPLVSIISFITSVGVSTAHQISDKILYQLSDCQTDRKSTRLNSSHRT